MTAFQSIYSLIYILPAGQTRKYIFLKSKVVHFFSIAPFPYEYAQSQRRFTNTITMFGLPPADQVRQLLQSGPCMLVTFYRPQIGKDGKLGELAGKKVTKMLNPRPGLESNREPWGLGGRHQPLRYFELYFLLQFVFAQNQLSIF